MNSELKVTNQLRGFARRLVAEGLLEEDVGRDRRLGTDRQGHGARIVGRIDGRDAEVGTGPEIEADRRVSHVEARCELRRSHEIRKQDRDLTEFSDFGRRMFATIWRNIGWSRHACDVRIALAGELFGDLQNSFAITKRNAQFLKLRFGDQVNDV